MTFAEQSDFKHEYARLRKRFLSLDDDFAKFKKVLSVLPRGTGGKHWNTLHYSEQVSVFKTRLACAYLRKSSLRIVYAYMPAEPRIEFLEIYYKGDEKNEDRNRIKFYLRNF